AGGLRWLAQRIHTPLYVPSWPSMAGRSGSLRVPPALAKTRSLSPQAERRPGEGPRAARTCPSSGATRHLLPARGEKALATHSEHMNALGTTRCRLRLGPVPRGRRKAPASAVRG